MSCRWTESLCCFFDGSISMCSHWEAQILCDSRRQDLQECGTSWITEQSLYHWTILHSIGILLPVWGQQNNNGTGQSRGYWNARVCKTVALLLMGKIHLVVSIWVITAVSPDGFVISMPIFTPPLLGGSWSSTWASNSGAGMPPLFLGSSVSEGNSILPWQTQPTHYRSWENLSCVLSRDKGHCWCYSKPHVSHSWCMKLLRKKSVQVPPSPLLQKSPFSPKARVRFG